MSLKKAVVANFHSNIVDDEIVLNSLDKLEDNTLSALRFDFTLEHYEGESIIAILKEIQRVCVHGALIEIKAQAYPHVDPLSKRFINDNLFDFCSAKKRQLLKQDPRFVTSCLAFEEAKINLHLVKKGVQLNALFDGKSDMLTFIKSNPDALESKSYYLVCLKDELSDNNCFALVNYPKLQPYLLSIYELKEGSKRYLSQDILQLGYWEIGQSQLLQQFLAIYSEHYNHIKIANIGANIGWYAVLAPKLCAQVSVDAFEPTPQTINKLKINLKLNHLEHKVKLHEIALSNTQAEVDFFVDDYNDGSNSLANSSEVIRSSNYKIKVKTDTLDNIYKAENPDFIATPPHILIMDTEGHEQKILEGAKALFTSGWRPLIFSEFSPLLLKLRGECTFHQELINQYHYQCYSMQIHKQDSLQLSPLSVDDLEHYYAFLADEHKNTEGKFLELLFVPPQLQYQGATFSFIKEE